MRPASKTITLARSDGAAATARWLRPGHVALPPSIAALTPHEEKTLLGVNAFVDRMVDLPLSTWLTIGETLMADREGLVVRQRAWNEVEAAIAEAGLGMPAWHVRDAVETAAYLVSRYMRCWSREERCRFAAAQGAADAAALSLLAQAHISTETLGTLVEPFTADIHLPSP